MSPEEKDSTTEESNPYQMPADLALDGHADWRLLSAFLIVAVGLLFATTPLMLVLLILPACNSIAFVILTLRRKTTAANLAALAGVLLVGALLQTDWGFSTPNPRIRISWICLVPAVVVQLALVAMPIWSKAARQKNY